MVAINDPLRAQLLTLLDSGNAHMRVEDALEDFPLDRINDTPPNVPYSPWQLLEHMRRTQRDILDYIQKSDYTELSWPNDYWPAEDATADEGDWNTTVEEFRSDLNALRAIVADESQDLNATVPSNDEHTILREIITIASHNHYHLGEFAILRQVMGAWPPDHE